MKKLGDLMMILDLHRQGLKLAVIARQADLLPEPVRPVSSRIPPGAADPKPRGRPPKYGGADRQAA